MSSLDALKRMVRRPVQIDVGIRGGVLASDSVQPYQLCSSVGCVYGRFTFIDRSARAQSALLSVSSSMNVLKRGSKQYAAGLALRSIQLSSHQWKPLTRLNRLVVIVLRG